MQLHELYQKIDLPEEAARRAKEAGRTLDLAALEPFLAGMMAIETAESAYRALSGRLTDDGDHYAMLYCQLECARRDAVRYREMGIGEDVFCATMKCFSRFLRECEVRNGRMFFDRGWWTYRQLAMRIFRIGELEYELEPPSGDAAVGLHIRRTPTCRPARWTIRSGGRRSFWNRTGPGFRASGSAAIRGCFRRRCARSSGRIPTSCPSRTGLRSSASTRRTGAFSNGCSARRRTRISPACPKPPACRGTSSACCSPAEMWAARRASSGRAPRRSGQADRDSDAADPGRPNRGQMRFAEGDRLGSIAVQRGGPFSIRTPRRGGQADTRSTEGARTRLAK